MIYQISLLKENTFILMVEQLQEQDALTSLFMKRIKQTIIGY